MRGAGGGRPRKPEGTQRHRNRPTHELVELPAGGREGAPPKPIVGLGGDAGRLWRRLWASPVACQWCESDVSGLTRLVQLATSPGVVEDPRRLAELRQLEQQYGLSPYARRQLRWAVGESGVAPVLSGSAEVTSMLEHMRLKMGEG